MPYNIINSKSDPLYPITNLQKERLLIEVDGIIISDVELIFYGMKDCPILEAYPFNTYTRLLNKSHEEIYEEIAYFRPYDLVLYLNDGEDISYEEITAIINYAILNYDYSYYTYLAMTEALRNLLANDFVIGVSFIISEYNKTIVEKILVKLFNIELLKKCTFIEMTKEDNIIQVIKTELLRLCNNETPYTSLITNEYQAIIDIATNYNDYNTSTMLYLLRNHSQNMEQSVKGELITFTEAYNDKINNVLYGDLDKPKLENLSYPIKSKIGRFTPKPYIIDSPSFMTFGESLSNTSEPI